jgi:di/tricarboxylate transporter
MDIAWISILALVVVIVVSCTTKQNPGVLAVVFAWIIGAYVAPALGVKLTLKQVIGGFPGQLFLTLTGVMLFFSQAQSNGTLDQIARTAVRLCRGNVGVIPVAFFLLTFVLTAVGAGSIAAAAMMAPVAMSVAGRAAVPPFLMTLMVAHGGVAGGMTPFALTGIVANGLMARIGLPGREWQIFFYNLLANVLVSFAGYLLFGGWRLFRRTYREEPGAAPAAPFERRHGFTLALIALLIVVVTAFKVDVGMAGFAAASLITIFGAADEKEAFKGVPWPVIVMVCGVTVLTAVLEQTGGIDRITSAIARISTPRTVPGVMAFFAGLTSVYSSTSGVVLPAFIPAIPGLAEKLPGANPGALASSITIGANIVDVSPLSTIGALCIAAVAGPADDRRLLFYKVLAWGLSMAVLAGLICLVLFGWRT